MNDEISKLKTELRKSFKTKRECYTKEELGQLSDQIFDHLIRDDIYQKSNVVHIYVSMNDRNEIDTRKIIDRLFNDEKRVVIPKIENNSLALSHHEVFKDQELVENKWGVLEPIEENFFDINLIELVIVPLLAIDLNGNRLGYGKGYYDRFLKQVHCKKIGLSISGFVVPNIPVNSNDVPLDGYVTENGINWL